jgi:hypothetical protein
VGAAHDGTIRCNEHGDEQVQRTQRGNREAIAALIQRCKGYFSRAMDETRLALKAEGVQVPQVSGGEHYKDRRSK